MMNDEEDEMLVPKLAVWTLLQFVKRIRGGDVGVHYGSLGVL